MVLKKRKRSNAAHKEAWVLYQGGVILHLKCIYVFHFQIFVVQWNIYIYHALFWHIPFLLRSITAELTQLRLQKCGMITVRTGVRTTAVSWPNDYSTAFYSVVSVSNNQEGDLKRLSIAGILLLLKYNREGSSDWSEDFWNDFHACQYSIAYYRRE